MKDVLTLAGLALLAVAFRDNKLLSERNRFLAGIRMRITKVNLQGQNLFVTFLIQNPNSENIVIRSVVGDFFINNRKVGNVSSFVMTNVAPNNETYFTVAVNVKFVNLLAVWYKYVEKTTAINTRFVGTININNKPFPVNVSYRVL